MALHRRDGPAHGHHHGDGDHDPIPLHSHAQGHTHGAQDPTLLTTARGIRAVQVSLVGLVATALIQVAVVSMTGSVALLADAIHNFGDAATAFPLWIAFALQRRGPSRRFTYGFGRVEDLAGLAIVLTILATAVLAGYESVQRLLHPQQVQHLGAVALAAAVGFLGNELVGLYRTRVGREMGSASLVADGRHARADGLVSLAVLVGAGSVALGFPLADPIVGLLITLAILQMVWESGREVFTRLLDGVDPEVVEQIRQVARRTRGVRGVAEVRVRWLGHRLHAEVNLAVDPRLSVAEGHALALEVQHRLLHRLRYLSDATIHVDPTDASGEEQHHVAEHSHGGLGPHSH